MTSASTKRRHTDPSAFKRVVRALRADDGKDAEIRRLRTAMVHAMDEAEAGARFPLAGLSERMRWQKVAKLLRVALETK